MDNNLTNFGSEPYQPGQPINCVYDCWGMPAALIRGLFEYLYRADGLTIIRTFRRGSRGWNSISRSASAANDCIWPQPAGDRSPASLSTDRHGRQYDATLGVIALRSNARRGGDPDRLGRREVEPFVPRKPAPVFVPIAALNQTPSVAVDRLHRRSGPAR